ncbi:prolipoprotein diacylglyceryl transferase [Cognatiluteimonas telluris]|uniref:prolipoprotein diacylglyceryl transferase n=1 Tax=Cognatiluteimonas telluris TaxID=1104775 RepID=UPI00140DA63B|nr:prolipoprotein diacylglyceryl transferase [Lysobacter telluris]
MIYLHQLDPVALALGPLQIHWYGVMYLLAFAACWFLGRLRIRAGRLPGVDEAGYGDLLFYCMLGVVLGGRIGYILFYDLSAYIAHPLDVLKIWQGGMSFHGGLLGVLVAAWWWSRRQGLHFFDVADFIAPLVPPGLGFGRIGNFINGELWGKFTHAGWGVIFPTAPEFIGWTPARLQAAYAAGALDQYARHPSPLYEATLEGLVMFVVLWVYSRKPRPRYRIAALFALMYGCFRFLVEFVRVPDAQLGYLAFGWLTMGQVLELPVIAFGLYCLWRSFGAPTLRPQPLAADAR